MAAILGTRQKYQYCTAQRLILTTSDGGKHDDSAVGELGLVPLGSSVRSCLPKCPYIFKASPALFYYLQHLCLFGCDLIIEFSVAQ